MDILSAFAGELDALASRLGRCTPGSRDVEGVYAEWDEIRRALTGLSSRMRHGGPVVPANADGAYPAAVVLTGRGQTIVCTVRKGGR